MMTKKNDLSIDYGFTNKIEMLKKVCFCMSIMKAGCSINMQRGPQRSPSKQRPLARVIKNNEFSWLKKKIEATRATW